MNNVVVVGVVILVVCQLALYVNSSSPVTLTGECNNSNDCEDQGFCFNGYCSCYSGFGGVVCADKPNSICEDEYNELSANVARFKPEIGVSFENSIVKMIIKAPLETTMYLNPSSSEDQSLVASNQVYSVDTTIRFIGVNGNDDILVENECNYPLGIISDEFSWNKPYATDAFEESEKDCSDIYELNLPWSIFRSSCRLQKINTNIFGQAIEITRNYAVPFESIYVTRTETLRRNIEFRFPDSVDVSSNVGVTAPATISVSAIISVKYNPQGDKWSIILITDTLRPFKLNEQLVVVSTDDATEERLGSVSIVPSQITTRQNIIIDVHSCESINSVFTVSLIADCYIPSECDPENERPVTISATIDTGNACPLVHTIALSTTSMFSYADPELTQSHGVFNSNDLAYFTANIDSDEATITMKELQTVCIALNSGACNYIPFDIITTQSDNPSFSISLASLNGLAQEGDFVTVKIRVSIEWQDTNKRSIQAFDVAMKSKILIGGDKKNKNNVIDMNTIGNSGNAQRFSMITILISFLFCSIAYL